MKSIILILIWSWLATGFASPIQSRHAALARIKATGGGGPTLIASDDFDSYSAAQDLDTAANWVTEGGSFYVSKPASDGYIYGGSTASALCRHTATFAANQRAEITIQAAGSGGGFNWIGPAVRIQSGANTGYAVVFSATDLYLISIVAGTQATINSDTGVTLTAGNKIAIECSGAGTSARLKVQTDTGGGWVDKWTDQNPAADIDGGSAGIGAWLLESSANPLDLWAGYDL